MATEIIIFVEGIQKPKQLYWSARDLKAAWLRAQHADSTEEQIAQEVTRLFTHART